MMGKFNQWTFSVLMLLFFATLAMAEGIKVTGRVIDKNSGDPLPGAEITVKGTFHGTASDIDGVFILEIPDVDEAELEITYIGYKTVTVKVTGNTDNLVIGMEEDILKTSEVVVTGFATTVKRQNLANAVATINAAELLPAPTQTLERALEGKFAGIRVTQNTGAPGGGIDVNLRGVSTIEGSTQPLYVVDGVIINNDAIQSGIDLVTKAAAAGSRNPQGQPTNRIADINPNDIESIEVLKGASAAAIYGSKATNGVIIITTKRGVPGKTRIDISQRFGYNSLLKKIGTRRFTADAALEAYGQQGLDIYNQNGGIYIDYEDEMYGERGFLSETSVSLRGGSNKSRFYVSGLARTEDGIIKNTGYQKYATRFNLEHKLSDRSEISVFTNYIRTESDRGVTGNDNTNITYGFSLAFTPSFLDIRPKNGEYPDHPFNPSNPLHTRDVFVNKELVNRFIISSQFKQNLYRSQRQTLNFIVQAGVDFFSQENKVISPPELQYERNATFPGASLLGETVSTNSNLYLNLVHNFSASSSVLLTTAAGLQFENANLNNSLIESRGLIPTQENIDQASVSKSFQERVIKRDRGFFIQEEVDIQGKIFLTAGLRGDASSANGDPGKYYLYPKINGSVRLSEFPFWAVKNLVPEFKIRAAYGATGNQPPANAKYTELVPSNIDGRAGLLPSTRRGSKDIRPERTEELEMGFDALFMDGRASLEFTYYTQNISDLFLIASLPPSSGFNEEFTNGGKMRTNGVEISLGVTPVRTHSLLWNARVNFYKTRSEITELTVDPFNKGGFATFLGTFRIQEGWSPTTIIGADVDANGNTIILGDATPDFQLSFSNDMNFNFSFGKFNVYFLWDWRQGGDVINLGKLITDLGATSADYDDPATDASLNLPANGVVKASDCSDQRLGPCRLELLGKSTAPYVEDGTFIKLRELSVSYSVPDSWLRNFFNGYVSYWKIGISGRNLLMFTKYQGYDPEVSQFGNVAIGRAIDTIPYPSSRTFYFNMSFGL
ncbi:MAG: SusC/RagA family TonB-linked outer membrane protein [Calditrichaeota bacterium]|nr:SusC/RagA family TonB-linked outer membrane protein [Calditrichota bacterium]